MCFDGWLVGSSADPDNKTPRDYDIVISPANWSKAAQLIPADAKVNSFGGWKCVSEGIELDVWPEDLNQLLSSAMIKFIYHPRSKTLYRRSNETS